MQIKATKYRVSEHWVPTWRGLFFATLVGSQVAISSLARWGMGQSPSDSAVERVIPSGPIPIIAPGTQVIPKSDKAVWNRLLLVADVKMNSGDVESVSETIVDAASKYSITLMASIENLGAPAATGRGQYRLAKVGAGVSASGSSGRIIISPDTASDLGFSPGIISGQVLRANQAQLADVKVVAKTNELAIFDAPSVMFRRGEHREYLTRHFLFLDASSGEGKLLVWLLAPSSSEKQQSMPVINNPIRVTNWGTVETRRIHVDEDQFGLFGVPSEIAFGLEDLPPGDDVNWTKQAAKLAGRKAYTQAQIEELFDSLRQAMLSGK